MLRRVWLFQVGLMRHFRNVTLINLVGSVLKRDSYEEESAKISIKPCFLVNCSNICLNKDEKKPTYAT